MKYAKSILMGTGGVVLAGLILTVLAPSAVHAVVATAVQVMNTAATPVPNKDVDEPARTAFTTSCRSAPGAIVGECGVGTPAGSIFVIETFSAFAGDKSVQVSYGTAQGDQQVFFPLTQTSDGYDGTFPVRLYVGPGNGIECLTNVSVVCTFSGHLVATP